MVDKNNFLFRLRDNDTPIAISKTTMNALMELTGMTKTDLTHLALRKMANNYLPRYEGDNGGLTNEQLLSIRAQSTASDISEEHFESSLI